MTWYIHAYATWPCAGVHDAAAQTRKIYMSIEWVNLPCAAGLPSCREVEATQQVTPGRCEQEAAPSATKAGPT